MLDTILTSPFFGLTLSAAAWCAGVWLQKKTGWVLCNPLGHCRRAHHCPAGRP